MAGGLEPHDLFSPKCWAHIRVDLPPQWPAHMRRIRWHHLKALLDYGIPMRDLFDTTDRPAWGRFKFGVITIKGRELIFTDDPRLRAWLHGPGLFKFPDVVAHEG